MDTNYERLSNEPNLALPYTNEAQLQAVITWCSEMISRDIVYQGAPEEQYERYVTLIKQFKTNFSALDNIQAIHSAAKLGYDQFILTNTTLSTEFINTPNDLGMTPLHSSSSNGHVYTTEALLSRGANPKQRNKQEQYPIQSSLFIPMIHPDNLMRKKTDIFNLLLTQAPETIYHQDKRGNTVFHYMVINGFEKLLKDTLSKYNQGAFYCSHFLRRYPIHDAIVKRQVGMTKFLLSIEGVSTLPDTKKRVAIHYAVQYGTQDILEACCQKTPDINIRDSELKTPLILAAEEGKMEAMQTLINHYNADASLVDINGYSILHHAVRTHNKALVSWILDHISIDIHQPDRHEHTALYYCQEARDVEIEHLLTEYEQNHSPS